MARRPRAPGPLYLLCVTCRRAWVADAAWPCDICGDPDPLDCVPGTYDAVEWFQRRTAHRRDELDAVRRRPWLDDMAALGDRAARPDIGGRAMVLVFAGMVPAEMVLGRRAAP
jgi:hypothetical protein